MARLTRFPGTSRADQRMLALAAVLYGVVAIAIRVLPFGRVRRVLAHVAVRAAAYDPLRPLTRCVSSPSPR